MNEYDCQQDSRSAPAGAMQSRRELHMTNWAPRSWVAMIPVRLASAAASITLRVRINDPPCGAASAAQLSNSARSRRDRQDYPARR